MILNNISSSVLDIRNDGYPMSRKCVKEAGFSDIGTTDDGNSWEHKKEFQYSGSIGKR